MRTQLFVAGALLVLAFATPVVGQQSPVVTPAEMDAALGARGQNVEADRATIARVLSRRDVRAAAEAHGLGRRLEDAQAAASALDGERLTQVAGYARSIELQLAGGQTISFNAITLIIILLLVIVVILLAN